MVVTLCTGAVAFTVTFLDKFTVHAEHEAPKLPSGLLVSWCLFGAAIALALWTLMAITGTLLSLDGAANGWTLTEPQKAAATTIAGRNVQVPALLMLVAFLAAVVAMMFAGLRAVPM